MKKSVKIRKIIFEILYAIYQKSINFEESYTLFTKNISLKELDRSMIQNIVLNSIRYNFFINNTLSIYLKKRTSIKIKILLLSAITQILYLGFKDYAVTNDTVEVAKFKKLNPGLINSLLKNIINERKKINKNNIDQSSVPNWFTKQLIKNKINLTQILRDISIEPSLHLVFKNKKLLDNFTEKNFRTTETSAFVKEKTKVNEIENFKNGDWWVQDFSSMLPIYLSPEFRYKNILDMCSAPGGKAFQALSLKSKVTLCDISAKRIIKLKNNLERLEFEAKIHNLNALNLPNEPKFDIVILDSPCSGIGTLRRNPEILFKKIQPKINDLIKIQTNLINKAAKLLKNNGVLIYMVCSFFYDETKAIKNRFLLENKNFSQNKFKLENKKNLIEFIDNDGDIYCVPSQLNNFMIDGFYAVKFIKND